MVVGREEGLAETTSNYEPRTSENVAGQHDEAQNATTLQRPRAQPVQPLPICKSESALLPAN